MPDTERHRPGMPAWVDAMVDSTDKRVRLMAFYSALHGWEWDEGVEASGYYSIARMNGRAVMGLGQGPGTEGKMVTYFATDDIAATASRATSLGANVFVGPMEVGGGSGQLALVLDPVGVVHGLWQEGNFAGFGAIYEPGTPGWFDHTSGDPSSAGGYYRDLLASTVIEPEPAMRVLAHGEQWFASVSNDPVPERPAQWNPIYIVESLEKLRRDVVINGGSIVVEEMPVPGSHITVFSEPVCHTLVTVMGQGTNEA